MSVRTIVEFNHDFAYRIAESPVGEFVDLLQNALRSGSRDDWQHLERYGIRFGVSTHHSTARKVVTPHEAVEF